MNTAKANSVSLASQKSPKFLAHLWEWVRSRRFDRLQIKLILPYLVLTTALASVGIFVTTSLSVSTEQERFHNSVLDASRVANDGLINQEKDQLNQLRYVIFADGMAQAVYDKNNSSIFNLMRPVLVSSKINLVTAIDTTGREIVTFSKNSDSEEYHRQENMNFSAVSSVQKVLKGVTDSQGDKFAELLVLNQGPVFFTVAPVQDANQKLVGAMMVGTYAHQILTDLKNQALADIILLDPNGKLIDSTISKTSEGFDNLLNVAPTLVKDGTTQSRDLVLNGWPIQVAYSPLMIRGVQVGWVGVIKNSNYIVNQIITSRNYFICIFAIGSLAVILIGYFLARNISDPILLLRSMSQAVAAGDLNHKAEVNRKDEIGELANAFDSMTVQLRERTEEAERLYAETLQRNKELAEINARLESTQLQLIQSEKLAGIGQLTAGIVHDVKNPFAVIMGMAEVLNEDAGLDEDTRHGLKVIRESAVKGNTIVSDLLKFARQSKPEMRTMDLRDTLQTAARLTAYQTRRYHSSLELPDTSLMVTYDAQLIEQVLINMIQNAVQSMPDGGKLNITLKQVNETAQISIQDTGCGIAPEHLNRIFDPFFTTKPEGEGTGLGLSVSYGIITSHHGRIEVESEVGQGSTFTIIMPLAEPSTSTGDIHS